MTNEQFIWSYFKQHTKWTDEGIAGLMGNLQAESALRPENVQNSYESVVGTDSEYVGKIDNGLYSVEQFQKDSAGFGLAQWTYWSRKKALFNFAKGRGVSIADLEMQCAFCVQEISTGYPGVNRVLNNATDVRSASNQVLFYYEQPANQGKNVQDTRTVYGEQIYKRNHAEAPQTETPTQAKTKAQLIAEIRAALEELEKL